MIENTDFKVLLEHLRAGWFPLWIGFDNKTMCNEDCLIVDWVCRWRVPDGKYFSTETVCTAEESETFRIEARAMWNEEMVRQFNDNKEDR